MSSDLGSHWRLINRLEEKAKEAEHKFEVDVLLNATDLRLIIQLLKQHEKSTGEG